MATQKSASSPQSSPVQALEPGCYIIGVIARRTRREVGEKRKVLVQYTVQCADSVQTIEHWEPQSVDACYPVGAEIAIKVNPSVRVDKRGIPRFAFRVPGCDSSEF